MKRSEPVNTFNTRIAYVCGAMMIMTSMLFVSCVPRYFIAPTLPEIQPQKSDFSKIDLYIEDFQCLNMSSKEKASDIGSLKTAFIGYIQARNNFRKIYDVSSGYRPGNGNSYVTMEVQLEPSLTKNRTWILDVLFFYPGCGYMPVPTPLWGNAKVKLNAYIKDKNGRNICSFSKNIDEKYSVLFYSWYRTSPAEDAFRSGYKAAFSKISDALIQEQSAIVQAAGIPGEVLEESPARVNVPRNINSSSSRMPADFTPAPQTTATGLQSGAQEGMSAGNNPETAQSVPNGFSTSQKNTDSGSIMNEVDTAQTASEKGVVVCFTMTIQAGEITTTGIIIRNEHGEDTLATTETSIPKGMAVRAGENVIVSYKIVGGKKTAQKIEKVAGSPGQSYEGTAVSAPTGRGAGGNKKEKVFALGHSRFFSGIGGNMVITKSIGSDIGFSYTTTYGTRGVEELKSDGFGGGADVLWLKFFINHKFAVDLSTHFSFIGKQDLYISGNYKASCKTQLINSQLSFTYNFWASEPQGGGWAYCYFGLGPGMSGFTRLVASGSYEGTVEKRDVKFSPGVFCLTPKLGASFAADRASFGADIYYPIPFDKQRADKITVNGEVVPRHSLDNPNKWNDINPGGFYMAVYLCYGW